MNTHTKPYTCPLCPYKAARSERLTWHAAKVHGKKICIKCFYVCDDQMTLSVHQLSTHQNGQSRQGFTCVMCAYTFKLHTELEAHMVAEHGRAMLDCSVCMFRTTDPAVLTDHVRYSHQQRPGAQPSPALPASGGSAAPPVILNVPSCRQVRPPLVCTHSGGTLRCQAARCRFEAGDAATLQTHVSARHADGALRCPHCAAPLGSVLEFCLHWPLHHVALCWSCAQLTEQHFTVLQHAPPPASMRTEEEEEEALFTGEEEEEEAAGGERGAVKRSRKQPRPQRRPSPEAEDGQQENDKE
ncbi:zinc finger protein 64-like [Amphibalanus amphitrite]|uniref:zinc finger protein 64-like n=1 Tax=Amphibalanus amphitrite TaxID=1232801 RepID=UPI001C91D1C6|nr:zinc finger protein 64-like [Amphibalanus amphitrite]